VAVFEKDAGEADSAAQIQTLQATIGRKRPLWAG
jgi:hypothetical protein